MARKITHCLSFSYGLKPVAKWFAQATLANELSGLVNIENDRHH
jgi:hypothetical protein